MEIKFKKLVGEAIMPKRVNNTDAGLDLVAISKRFETLKGIKKEDGEEFVTEDSAFVEYGTGLAVEIPSGFVGLLFPRSSVTNKQMMLKNSVGVIDSDYRGEIKARFMCLGEDDSDFQYEVGERVVQLLIVPIILANPIESTELSDTSRGEGGFGSTGK